MIVDCHCFGKMLMVMTALLAIAAMMPLIDDCSIAQITLTHIK